MSSVDGRHTEYILVTCDDEGILGNHFSAVFSKSDDDDDLMKVTATGLGGEVFDSGKTTAEFGLVSIGSQLLDYLILGASSAENTLFYINCLNYTR